MPRIELIEPVFYSPSDPIHWEVDNIPLNSLVDRENLINLALDNVIEQMRDAIGTQNTVANRLNQSLNPDGSLQTSAIDSALHSIEEHTDTENYVRMTTAQSSKLDLIADEATNIELQIYTDNVTNVLFSNGVLKIKPSSTVTPSFESPNVLTFNLAFPTEAAHQHYYGLVPVSADLIDPDYINYKVNSGASAFIDGSLRVFINGFRIFSDAEVYVQGAMVNDPMTLLSFTPNSSSGTFALSTAITEEDVIRIDFDIALV